MQHKNMVEVRFPVTQRDGEVLSGQQERVVPNTYISYYCGRYFAGELWVQVDRERRFRLPYRIYCRRPQLQTKLQPWRFIDYYFLLLQL